MTTTTTATLAPWITRRQASNLRTVAADQGAAIRRVKDMTAPLRPATDNRTPAPAGFAPAVTRTATRRPAPAAAPAAPQRPAGPTFAEVDALLAQIPVGRYALPKANGGVVTDWNNVTFFEVAKGRKGGHMIRTLAGAPGQFQAWPMKLVMQFHAARHIAEDARAAAVLFGRTTSRCFDCNSPLTNQKSREAGIGPKCAKKFR